MDAADLRVFETVARIGGIGRAAQELHTVQSNVTARIRRLEEELGVPLFDRHSRGVSLTSAGRRLLPYATQAERLLSEARRAVEDGPEPHGPLTLGSLETTAAIRLTPILIAYARECPQVDVTLNTGTSRALITDVLEHRLEGAFVVGPVRHPELVEEPVVTEELVLVTAPSVPLDDLLRGSAPVKVLVFRSGCTYRQHLEEHLAARGVKAFRTLEFGTLDGILGCVSAGMGITLLPRAVVEAGGRARTVAVHPLPAARARVTTVFIRRREGFTSRALLRFLDCAQRVHRTAGHASSGTERPVNRRS